MTTTSSKQMTTGKSFEYALLTQFDEKLKSKTNVQVVKNKPYLTAKGCFENLSQAQKSDYLLTASFAVNFLEDIEPRLSNDIGKNDVLQLELSSDPKGGLGDVRDVLAIRLLQKWEIGVSAKNNHHAVKHSRLSSDIDFGKKWFGINSSTEYFDSVVPIFDNLKKIRNESGAQKKWSEIGDYHTSIYVPILSAFIKELENIYKTNQTKVARSLITYLVGNKDFYKVIKTKNQVEIEAYNLYGLLNLPINNIQPKYITPKISLPTKITNIAFRPNSQTTIIVTLDNDWELSFRIHNASSRVEPSLKFDINLLSCPKQLFKNTLSI